MYFQKKQFLGLPLSFLQRSLEIRLIHVKNLKTSVKNGLQGRGATHQSLPVVLEVWWEMCQYWVFPGLRLFPFLYHLPLQICLPTRGESLLWCEHAWSQKKGARIRGFTKFGITWACDLKSHWYLRTLSLKGVFSKPSGNCIVSPNLCFFSWRPNILATC